MKTSGGRKLLFRDNIAYRVMLKEGENVEINNVDDPEEITVKIEVTEPAYRQNL